MVTSSAPPPMLQRRKSRYSWLTSTSLVNPIPPQYCRQLCTYTINQECVAPSRFNTADSCTHEQSIKTAEPIQINQYKVKPNPPQSSTAESCTPQKSIKAWWVVFLVYVNKNTDSFPELRVFCSVGPGRLLYEPTTSIAGHMVSSFTIGQATHMAFPAIHTVVVLQAVLQTCLHFRRIGSLHLVKYHTTLSFIYL